MRFLVFRSFAFILYVWNRILIEANYAFLGVVE